MLMSETPLFIKITEYKEVEKILEVIKKKIISAEEMLKEIKQLKDEEDRELQAWSNNLEEITKKIESVDKTIFGEK